VKTFKQFLLESEKKKPEELSPEQKAKRQRKKNEHLVRLCKNMNRLTKKVSQDLSSADEEVKLTAAAVRTMLDTSERVGNKSSASQGHYGITGLKCKHVRREGGRIKLRYVGKSGMKQEKEIKDKRVFQAMNSGGGDVFKTKDGSSITNIKINSYLKEFGITSKDIRGYNANRLMTARLSGLKIKDEAERKKKFLEILDEVAEKIGHTASMLRNSYLHPEIEDSFVKTGKVRKIR